VVVKRRSVDIVLALRDNPEFQVQMYLSGWENSANPVYLWKVIAVCTKHDRPVPKAVMRYLGQVAQRMDEMKEEKDLRKVLPGIVGFSMRRGPGRPLDLDDNCDPHVVFLPILFWSELERGRRVKEALRNAATNEAVPQRFADAEDPTLKRWIASVIQLDGPLPRTEAEWRAVLRS
jgi:hypothetical protein